MRNERRNSGTCPLATRKENHQEKHRQDPNDNMLCFEVKIKDLGLQKKVRHERRTNVLRRIAHPSIHPSIPFLTTAA